MEINLPGMATGAEEGGILGRVGIAGRGGKGPVGTGWGRLGIVGIGGIGGRDEDGVDGIGGSGRTGKILLDPLWGASSGGVGRGLNRLESLDEICWSEFDRSIGVEGVTKELGAEWYKSADDSCLADCCFPNWITDPPLCIGDEDDLCRVTTGGKTCSGKDVRGHKLWRYMINNLVNYPLRSFPCEEGLIRYSKWVKFRFFPYKGGVLELFS